MQYWIIRFLLVTRMATVHAFSVTTTPSPCRTSFSSATQLAALTPNQIKLLRKEAAKRMAGKSLAQVFLPENNDNDDDDDDDDMADDETLDTILQELQQHELVQVRGIARDNVRHVYAETQRMVLELNLLLSSSTQTVVDCVETSGHSSILYAPADPPRITLRSSYKEGQWTKKPKKPRDRRGQIVLGDDDDE